jgi:hypothetical protein
MDVSDDGLYSFLFRTIQEIKRLFIINIFIMLKMEANCWRRTSYFSSFNDPTLPSVFMKDGISSLKLRPERKLKALQKLPES